MLIFILLLNTFVFLINFVMKNKSTLSVKLSFQSLISIISILMSVNINLIGKILTYLLIIVYMGLIIWFMRYPDFNFSKNIISFSKFKNNLQNNKEDLKNKRLVGKLQPFDEDELKYDGLNVTLNEKTINEHTLIVAGSGAGKSRLMRSFMRQDINSGMNVVLFDYASKKDMANPMIDYAKKHNYEIFVMTKAMYDFSYDPLPYMTQTAIKQILMNTQENWQDYYKNETIQFLDKAIYDFEKEYKTPQDRKNYLSKLKSFILDKYAESDGRRNALSTVNFFLGSELGAMFSGLIEKRLDYRQLVKNHKKFMVVVTFGDAEKDLAYGVSSIFLNDLLETFEHQQEGRPKIYGDEASTLKNSDLWKGVLSRGRSAGLGTLITYQSIHQISSGNDNNEGAIKLMLDAVETKIILASNNTKESAQYLSDSTYDENVEEKIESLRLYNDKTKEAPTLFILNSNNGITKGKSRGFIVKTEYFDYEVENNKYPNYLSQVEQNYKKILYQDQKEQHVNIDIDRKNEKVNNGQREIHENDLTSFL